MNTEVSEKTEAQAQRQVTADQVNLQVNLQF